MSQTRENKTVSLNRKAFNKGVNDVLTFKPLKAVASNFFQIADNAGRQIKYRLKQLGL